MNLTKIILRKSHADESPLRERVHFVPASSPWPGVSADDTERLTKLGHEYRSFKMQHPEKWARLPVAIKQAAEDLGDRGVAVETIANACGTQAATVYAWLRRGKPRAAKSSPDYSKLIGTTVPLTNLTPSPSQLPPVLVATKGAVPMDSTKLNNLAEAYKAFKKTNPERWARLPTVIKDEAIALLEAKVSAEAIANACGIHTGTVLAWARPRTQPVGRPSLRTIADREKASTNPAGWVRVRVRGTEVEVSESDFLRLFT